MTPKEKAAIALAVECLIDDPDAVSIFRQMEAAHDLARKNVPVRLVGRPSVLNPLIDLWLEDESTAHRVFDLVNRKRSALGLPPIGDEDYNRRAYMRELMAQKRERLRRLANLFNQLRTEDDKIKGPARDEFVRLHGARWNEVKTERENALRDRLDRRLTIEELNEVRTQLWKEVDQELEALEEFVRSEIRKPVHARAPEGFKFMLKPSKASPLQ